VHKYIILIYGLLIPSTSQLFSQNESGKIDSFEIYRKILDFEYEVEYSEFIRLLKKMEEYGDIHHYVLERIEETKRTPIMHEYYPAFLSFICGNMDTIYRKELIKRIKYDSIERYIAYPIVKSYLFKTKEETCEYLYSINLEYQFAKTNSLMFESLIKLKNEMKCSK
jgi:hypothetical protein